MDAIRTLWRVWPCFLFVIGGCTWDQQQAPTTRNEQQPATQSHEPPQIVEQKSVPDQAASEDYVNSVVINYIEQVDAARQRADSRAANRPLPKSPPGLLHPPPDPAAGATFPGPIRGESHRC